MKSNEKLIRTYYVCFLVQHCSVQLVFRWGGWQIHSACSNAHLLNNLC